MVDAQGRPYFLWDVDMTLDELTRQLAEADLPVRAYLTGKVMRQAKPDDALQFISAQQMADLWPHLEKYPGNKRTLELADRGVEASWNDQRVASAS
jgi:hypothetical protein